MPGGHAATPEEMGELIVGTPTTDPSWFLYGDVVLTPPDIVAILESRVSDGRRELFERVLDERTDNVAVVIEGMVDLGNVGAVMRSADGFGMQKLHAIDTAGAYKRSRRTSQGADKWLDRYGWTDPEACLAALSTDGYAVIATDLEEGAAPIDEVDLTGRIAVVFGNELTGISETTRRLAAHRMVIPMSGFSESFNISVAAALTLHEVRRRRIERYGATGDLSPARRDEIRAVWYLKSVRESRLVVERALADGYRVAGT